MVAFVQPLMDGVLVQRYKRFLADIRLEDDTIITAHCANTGPLTDLTHPGLIVRVLPRQAQAGKLGYSWEMALDGSTWVGVDTRIPNLLVREAASTGQLALPPYEPVAWMPASSVASAQTCPWPASWPAPLPDPLGESPLVLQGFRAEVPLPSLLAATSDLTSQPELSPPAKMRKHPITRLDFCLQTTQGPLYVEVKNVHLKRGQWALFPDTITERGARHLQDMTHLARQGVRVLTLYVIQRPDVQGFAIAGDIDPTYAAAFHEAVAAGMGVAAVTCTLNVQTITWSHRVPCLGVSSVAAALQAAL